MSWYAKYEARLLLAVVVIAFIVSGIEPYDRATWYMEVAPVIIGIPILLLTRGRFSLTWLLYRLLALHALVLIIGGHYTYARVPIGDWVQDFLELSRNHYDRFAHVIQGFVPAILAREVLLRCTPLRRGGWLFFLVATVCLAVSALYELIEWWAAVFGGEAAADFLGTQGDVWDTQWDMFLALCGALGALILVGRFHDRALARLEVGYDEA